DAGIHQVRTPREMAAVLAGLGGGRRSPGRRVAVFTDGGGHGAIAAEAVESAGLEVPETGGATAERLRGFLWEQSAVGNPVDLAGMGERDPMSYARAVDALLSAEE